MPLLVKVYRLNMQSQSPATHYSSINLSLTNFVHYKRAFHIQRLLIIENKKAIVFLTPFSIQILRLLLFGSKFFRVMMHNSDGPVSVSLEPVLFIQRPILLFIGTESNAALKPRNARTWSL